MNPRAGWLAAWLCAGGYLLWTLCRLALHDSLTSIADDSSNYLVMARHYSPWHAESEAVRSVWPLQYFPPLFPLLLAATGAAHSLLAAHALVVGCGLVCLVALHRLLVRGFGAQPGAAHAVTLLVALLPGFAFGLQGVLSEALFLLLTLGFMTLSATQQKETTLGIAAGALLLAAAMLTRSAGYVLLLALLIQAAVATLTTRRLQRWPLAVAVLAALIHVATMQFTGPVQGAGEYARVWRGTLDSSLAAGFESTAQFLIAQLRSIAESWCAFLLVYWRSDRPVAVVVAALMLLLALVGMLVRLRSNRLDAWYSAGSLVMLLLWPHPGQMMRLLFPLVPVLAAQAAWCLWSWRRSRGILAPCVALLVFAIVLPPHAYLHGRLQLASELGMVPVYEWLRKPDPDEARRELGVQNRMLHDFAELPGQVEPAASIAYYEPSYIALIGDRRSVPSGYPPDMASLRAGGDARYLLLTAIHPRLSRTSVDGLSLLSSPVDAVQVQWCTREPLRGAAASCLLRIERAGSGTMRSDVPGKLSFVVGAHAPEDYRLFDVRRRMLIRSPGTDSGSSRVPRQ